MPSECPICGEDPLVHVDALGNSKRLHSTMKCCGKVICLRCLDKSFRTNGCPFCRSLNGLTFVDLADDGDIRLMYQERSGRNETLRLTLTPSDRTFRMLRSTLKRTAVGSREDFLRVTDELFQVVLSCCVYFAERHKDDPILRAVFYKHIQNGAKVERVYDATYRLEEGGTLVNFSWKALWPASARESDGWRALCPASARESDGD